MTEIIITSSVLILVIISLRHFWKEKISLRLQYALWALVLVRLLVPVFPLESPVSVMNAAAPVAERSRYVASTVLGYIGYTTPDLAIAEPDPDASSEEREAQYTANRGQWQTEINQAKAEIGTPVTVSEVLNSVWLTGICIVGLCLLLSNLSFGRKLRKTRAKYQADNCRLPVYEADALPSPCLFGLLRPAIYITPDVAGNETKLRHVLAHETAHWRHGDHIWSALRGLCLAIHWYNPLVWLAAALSRRDAELACDEAAIKSIGEAERMAYGRTLIGLTCEKRSAMDLLCCATTMTDGKRGIKERILLIAIKPKMATYTLIGVILAAGLALALTFTGAAGTDMMDGGAYTLELPSRFDYAFSNTGGSEKDTAEFTLRGRCVGGVALYFYEEGLDGLDDLREFSDFLKAEGLFENAESTMGGSSVQAGFEFSIKPFDGREQKHYFFFTATDAVYDLWFDTGAFTDAAIKRVRRSFTIAENGNAEAVPLAAAEVEQYNKAFAPLLVDEQGNSSVNPLSHLFTSYYDRPEDIDLAQFLRYFPSEKDVTDEAEFETLKAAENWPFGADMTMGRMPVPIHKFPADTVNEALKTHMGITLDDLSGVGLNELIYLKEYDAYYNFTSDFAAGTFFCTSGERQGDIIRLYGDTATLTLKTQGGGYLFVSHQRIGEGTNTGGGGENSTGIVMEGIDVPDVVLAAATVQIAGRFESACANHPDYAYVNWRIESLKWAYTYKDLNSLALNVYRMNYEFLSDAPENVMLAGGMYVTDDGWVCPTYPDCTYLVFDAGSDEFLLAMMENDCEAGDETFTADLTESLLRRKYDSDTGAVAAFVDINRDGMEETLYLDKSQMDSGSFVTLRVYDGNGNEIWSEDAGTPHAGWNSLFLCNLEGKDYLLRYNPGMWQGRGAYTYTLFTLEGGAETVYQTDTLKFDINGAEPLDPERMVGFADEVNTLLKTSMLLLSSEDGVFTFGPVSAKPFLETYSWLEGNPELYAEGDDLATRLQKYSDYAVSKRTQIN